MRKLAYTAFVAFWAAVGTLLLVERMSRSGAAVNSGTYTPEEVANHATPGDCWIAVEGRVYDITGYLPRHPSRPGVVEPWCGREATEGMRTKGYGPDHSSHAWAELARYRVGDLREEAPAPGRE